MRVACKTPCNLEDNDGLNVFQQHTMRPRLALGVAASHNRNLCSQNARLPSKQWNCTMTRKIHPTLKEGRSRSPSTHQAQRATWGPTRTSRPTEASHHPFDTVGRACFAGSTSDAAKAVAHVTESMRVPTSLPHQRHLAAHVRKRLLPSRGSTIGSSAARSPLLLLLPSRTPFEDTLRSPLPVRSLPPLIEQGRGRGEGEVESTPPGHLPSPQTSSSPPRPETPPGPPKISLFCFLPPPMFFLPSFGGLFVELWARFQAEFHTKCAFGLPAAIL